MTPIRFNETLGLDVLASLGFNRESFGKCSTQQPRQYLSMGGSCDVDGLALAGAFTGMAVSSVDNPMPNVVLHTHSKVLVA